MNPLPTLQEEVNRKAFEAMAWLVSAVTRKQITVDQFSTGVDTLFAAVSGLVTDPDFMQMITEAQFLIDKEKANERKAGSSGVPEAGAW